MPTDRSPGSLDSRAAAGARRAVAALACLIALGAGAAGAELTVLSSNGTAAVVRELGQRFERATGHRLAITYDVAALIQKDIERGAPFDVAVLTTSVVDSLARSGKVDAATRVLIARSGIGVAVPAGAEKPDIGSVEAFRRTMLAAKSIAYTTVGGSGIHFMRVCERLGIAPDVQAKGRRQAGGAVAELVAAGEAELAVQQISELLPVAGTELVGPFPAELQLITAFSAAVGTAANEPAAAKALIGFFTTPDAQAVIKSAGMEPGEAAAR